MSFSFLKEEGYLKKMGNRTAKKLWRAERKGEGAESIGKVLFPVLAVTWHRELLGALSLRGQ